MRRAWSRAFRVGMQPAIQPFWRIPAPLGKILVHFANPQRLGSNPMKPIQLLPLFAAFVFVTGLQAQHPDQPRAEAEQLFEKAKHAKAEGRNEEADELTRRAKGLQSEPKEGNPSKPGIDKLGMAKHEIEELHRAGKHEQAEQMERRLAETMRGKHEQRTKGGGGSPDRLAHVGQAIEHLRAAGLGEEAGHLEQVAHRMQEEMAHRGHESAGGKPGAEPMREMQEHMQQLSGQLQKMARGIEELRGEVKDLHAQPAKKKGSEKTE